MLEQFLEFLVPLVENESEFLYMMEVLNIRLRYEDENIIQTIKTNFIRHVSNEPTFLPELAQIIQYCDIITCDKTHTDFENEMREYLYGTAERRDIKPFLEAKEYFFYAGTNSNHDESMKPTNQMNMLLFVKFNNTLKNINNHIESLNAAPSSMEVGQVGGGKHERDEERGGDVIDDEPDQKVARFFSQQEIDEEISEPYRSKIFVSKHRYNK